MLEVVRTLCRVAGSGVTPDVPGAGVLLGEIPRQWVDSSKLQEMSGWIPRTSLEDGLARTVEWYRGHVDRLR